MSIRVLPFTSASALLFALSVLPNTAHAAALDQCGGIFLTSASQCEFRPVQDCTTSCATTSVEQACAQKTYTTCSTGCSVTDTTSCMQTHSTSCSMECDSIMSQSSHDVCVSECTNDCTTDAVSKNDFNGDMDECSKNCSHDCFSSCDSCSTTDQSTTCTDKCMSIVQNECTEEVTRDCVLDCQTMNYTSCETDTVNTCNTTCTDKGGALFCDGQFVDASDIKACADQLHDEFSFTIDLSAMVTVNGNGSVTTTNSNGTKSTTKCSFGPAPRDSHGMILGALAALGIVVARRRRRG
jgi:hypothetical protein